MCSSWRCFWRCRRPSAWDSPPHRCSGPHASPLPSSCSAPSPHCDGPPPFPLPVPVPLALPLSPSLTTSPPPPPSPPLSFPTSISPSVHLSLSLLTLPKLLGPFRLISPFQTFPLSPFPLTVLSPLSIAPLAPLPTHPLPSQAGPEVASLKRQSLKARLGQNRIAFFWFLDLYWRSPESGGVWYKSRLLKKMTCSRSEGWWKGHQPSRQDQIDGFRNSDLP